MGDIWIENKHTYTGEGHYVGRGSNSYLGNPFPMKDESKRAEVIAKYKVWLWNEMKKGGFVLLELNDLVREYKETGELILICWCHPLPCHCDVLAAAIRWLASK